MHTDIQLAWRSVPEVVAKSVVINVSLDQLSGCTLTNYYEAIGSGHFPHHTWLPGSPRYDIKFNIPSKPGDDSLPARKRMKVAEPCKRSLMERFYLPIISYGALSSPVIP